MSEWCYRRRLARKRGRRRFRLSSADSSSSRSVSRSRRAATSRTDRLWDYGVIPYDIDSNFSGNCANHLRPVHKTRIYVWARTGVQKRLHVLSVRTGLVYRPLQFASVLSTADHIYIVEPSPLFLDGPIRDCTLSVCLNYIYTVWVKKNPPPLTDPRSNL